MKKFFALIILLVMFFCFSAVAQAAKWKLYDDFESYQLGPFSPNDTNGKWGSESFNPEVANITIEEFNGSQQLKFDYNSWDPHPDLSTYLTLDDCIETIVGIKVDVTVEYCEGNQDCRARIAWHRGTSNPEKFYLWEAVQVESNKQGFNWGYITTEATKLDQSKGFGYMGNPYWARFNGPMKTIGKTYTVTALFDKPDTVTVTVEGQGTTTYKYNSKLGNPIELFKAIGMRVQSGRDWVGNWRITYGGFGVWFDNVYVMRKGRCDKKGPKVKKVSPKKLGLDDCWISIEFNEVAGATNFSSGNATTWEIESDPLWPIDEAKVRWSNDLKTIEIPRANCGTDLPPNTKLKFIINPNAPYDPSDPHFQDLKGNPAKTKTITIKTGKQ